MSASLIFAVWVLAPLYSFTLSELPKDDMTYMYSAIWGLWPISLVIGAFIAGHFDGFRWAWAWLPVLLSAAAYLINYHLLASDGYFLLYLAIYIVFALLSNALGYCTTYGSKRRAQPSRRRI